MKVCLLGKIPSFCRPPPNTITIRPRVIHSNRINVWAIPPELPHHIIAEHLDNAKGAIIFSSLLPIKQDQQLVNMFEQINPAAKYITVSELISPSSTPDDVAILQSFLAQLNLIELIDQVTK